MFILTLQTAAVMKSITLLFVLFVSSVFSQHLPEVHFNHFYLVVDSSDLKAIQHSKFIIDTFAATITKTTIADRGVTWAGTYLYGLDNYFEIFDNKGFVDTIGNAGIGFSVDHSGEIKILDSIFQKHYKIETGLRAKLLDNKEVPWFNMLGIADSAFFVKTHIYSWIMEYRKEYFDYRKLPHKRNNVTRRDYLCEYQISNKTKLLKRFTSITLRVTKDEKLFYAQFLLNCGYTKNKTNGYKSPDGFVFYFIDRKAEDISSVESVQFENNYPYQGTFEISEKLQLVFKGKTGAILFK
jgi:hypothetical protein